MTTNRRLAKKKFDEDVNPTFKMQLLPHQKAVSNFLRENQISILLAEAGCAKDFVQMYRALDGLMKKEFEKIVISKPIVEIGTSIGFLPGLDEKFFPYERSFRDTVSKILGKENNNINSKIVFEHTGFLRGNTLPAHSVIILSEGQNLSLHQILSYVTRVPDTSKLFINADPMQSDLGRKSGLQDFLKIMEGIEGVGILELDGEIHQMRSKIIVDINKNYRKFLKGEL